MAKCSLCGKKIQPYFDICSGCYQKRLGEISTFSDTNIKMRFMQEMGINQLG